jgi:hypothetical protein
VLPELDDSDWEEAFKYAQPKVCEAGHEHGPSTVITEGNNKADSFTREDVDQIIAMVNGENDESDWVGVFRLKDSRYACLRAWCDYTGWG